MLFNKVAKTIVIFLKLNYNSNITIIKALSLLDLMRGAPIILIYWHDYMKIWTIHFM
jgi:hypothetical protein